jgi:hypothetical protein
MIFPPASCLEDLPLPQGTPSETAADSAVAFYTKAMSIRYKKSKTSSSTSTAAWGIHHIAAVAPLRWGSS